MTKKFCRDCAQAYASLKHYVAKYSSQGFTLIELLVVMAMIGILAGAVLSTVQYALQDTQTITTGQVKQQLTKASQLYWVDMGFYPPDVNRGWDPGFVRPLPWNSDIEDGESVPGWASTPGTDCSHCPADWEDIVAQRWAGPYVSAWPDETAWQGEFDYNYWPSSVTRNGGCVVSPGIYAGAQANYDNDDETRVPDRAEQKLVELGLDDDGCVNQESQLLLHPL